jgi:branched-chain amino acid transport system permease protein
MLLQQLINGITQGSLFALLAISFSVIYGVLKLLNFATGSIYMMGAFTGWLIVTHIIPNIFVALAGAMITGWILGFIIEKVAIKMLRGVSRIASLICTIGFSIFLNELANLLFGAQTQSMPSFFSGIAFSLLDVRVVWYQIFIVGITGVILLVLQILIFRTKLGLAVRTVSTDFKTAGLMGVNVDRVSSFAFSLGGSMAAIAGVLASVYYNAVFPAMGNIPALKSFTAAVCGGLTTIPGAILGGFLLGIVENLGVQIISSGYRDIIGFIILIGFLLFRPSGIFGKRVQM